MGESLKEKAKKTHILCQIEEQCDRIFIAQEKIRELLKEQENA